MRFSQMHVLQKDQEWVVRDADTNYEWVNVDEREKAARVAVRYAKIRRTTVLVHDTLGRPEQLIDCTLDGAPRTQQLR